MIHSWVVLLLSFIQIGLLSFGGGYAAIPLIKAQTVDVHQWLTLQEFTDIITISQMTPGPLAVNTSTFVGIRIAGIFGALAATAGCVAGGFVLSILLYRFFQSHKEAEGTVWVLKGLRSCSTGLIGASAVTILEIAFLNSEVFQIPGTKLNGGAALIFVLSLFVLKKYKLSPMIVMVVTGAAGIFLYGR